MTKAMSPVSDEQIIAALEAAGVEFQQFYSPSKKAHIRCTAGSQHDAAIIIGIRALLAQAAPVAAQPQEAGQADELASMTRMFHAACADLGRINEALGLDPDDGGADPILDAIEELKAAQAAPAMPLTTCRHCGFRVALNEAPQEEAPAAPDEQWESAQIDAFNKWMLTASRNINAFSAMAGWMASARASLTSAPAQEKK